MTPREMGEINEYFQSKVQSETDEMELTAMHRIQSCEIAQHDEEGEEDGDDHSCDKACPPTCDVCMKPCYDDHEAKACLDCVKKSGCQECYDCHMDMHGAHEDEGSEDEDEKSGDESKGNGCWWRGAVLGLMCVL